MVTAVERLAERLAALALVMAVALPVLRVVGVGGEGLYAIPVALLALACALAAAGGRAVLPSVAGHYVLVTVLLLAWLTASGLWTVSPGQYRRDLVLLVGLLAIMALAAFSLTARVARAALALVVAGGALTAAWLVGQYARIGTLSAYQLPIGDAYLPIAQLLGAAAVGATAATLCWGGRTRWWVAGALVSFAGVALSMARGALLSAVAVVLLVFLAQAVLLLQGEFGGSPVARVSRRTWKRVAGLLAAPLLAGLALVLALQVDRTAARLRRLFSGEELARGGRGWIWERAWASLAENPLTGYGLGSSGTMSGQMDGNYAHNLLLQVWLDGGLLAVLLLLVVMILPFALALVVARTDRSRFAAAVPFLAVYLFMILEFSKSGNFYSARGFFVFGLLSAFALGAHAASLAPAAQVARGRT
jgi:O-antigen ligase